MPSFVSFKVGNSDHGPSSLVLYLEFLPVGFPLFVFPFIVLVFKVNQVPKAFFCTRLPPFALRRLCHNHTNGFDERLCFCFKQEKELVTAMAYDLDAYSYLKTLKEWVWFIYIMQKDWTSLDCLWHFSSTQQTDGSDKWPLRPRSDRKGSKPNENKVDVTTKDIL